MGGGGEGGGCRRIEDGQKQSWARTQEIQFAHPVLHPVKYLRAQIHYIKYAYLRAQKTEYLQTWVPKCPALVRSPRTSLDWLLSKVIAGEQLSSPYQQQQDIALICMRSKTFPDTRTVFFCPNVLFLSPSHKLWTPRLHQLRNVAEECGPLASNLHRPQLCFGVLEKSKRHT